jgi:diaminopimelate decarboxylase
MPVARGSSTELRISVRDSELVAAIQDAVDGCIETPSRVFFASLFEKTCERVAGWQATHRAVRVCYSVKTNPRSQVLRTVRANGLGAEVISPHEVAHALDCGFEPHDLVYNGPIPASLCTQVPGCIFADSVQAYVSAARSFPDTIVGTRLRLPQIQSRFGIPVDQLDDLADAIQLSARREIAISLHVRPQDYGQYDWRSLITLAVELARQIEDAGRARVIAFDVGGGKRPDEFDAAIAAGDFQWLQTYVTDRLDQVRTVICEPGQALATSSEAVIARIVEVRKNGKQRELVLDAGYPELPQINTFSHRLFLVRGAQVTPIPRNGSTRLVGRTCLEYDVIASDAQLDACAVNDLVVIADAGAYDASMAFAFSQGSRLEGTVW